MPTSHSEPDRFTYLGLFLTTLSLLQLELFLTRIFSVTMWYHFAFMAISLAMFGLAAGAVAVEVMEKRNPRTTLARLALLFAASSATCFVAQLQMPVNPETDLKWTALAFTVIAIPFVFAGMIVCVALTRFPSKTSSLYSADLAGSAAGCLLTIPILDHIHAPTAVILNAGLAALGAAAFAMQGFSSDRKGRHYRLAGDARPYESAIKNDQEFLKSATESGGPVRGSSHPAIFSQRNDNRFLRRYLTVSALLCLFLMTVALVNQSQRFIDIRWIKGGRNSGGGIYEKWNALSRIYVRENSNEPFGWGLSPKYQSDRKLEQLYLNIDSGAATVITKFAGNLQALDHLKYDVTALAHYLRKDGPVLVIGVGGGRDILTSLAFGHQRVTGVEINPDILGVLTGRFSEYAGNLQRLPGVSLVHDEARSYVARSAEKFEIIQASLIDTWAATSAGAYVLTENGLYTKEAWLTFLQHLTPDGILTMSRWYYEAQPAETLRLAALASSTLMELGVQNPRNHMMIVRKQDSSESGQYSVATILVSPNPFSDADTKKIQEVSQDMEFFPVLTPDYADLPEFEAISDPRRYADLIRTYPLNIDAPTDDTPFFFHMLRASDLLKSSTYQGMNEINLKAVEILGTLLGIVVGLSAVAIIIPLALRSRVREEQSPRMLIYFASIGLAFMMVEIGQLERLIVFLGHPIYGLTVVLFVLLLASSLGSLLADRVGRAIWLLPVLLLVFILGSPLVIRGLASAATPLRITLSAAMLLPTGFFMGAAFPIGIKRARLNDGSPTAWYWGINGAFSVISSVLALVVAVFWGVTATLLVGLSAYVLALVSLGKTQKTTQGART